MLVMPFHNTLHFLCVAERWHLKINLTWSSAPSPSRGGRKATETPLSWRWVRSCCHVTPTTAGSWVWDSCWSGWTPQPACLVRKHGQIWLEYSNKPTKKHYLSYLNLFVQQVQHVTLILWCLLFAVMCLNSAERHAGCSCVTASVDDIHFEHTIG